jgi:hypothetical protein
MPKSIYKLFIEAGALAKYVIINFDQWNSTTPDPGPVQEISLRLPEHVSRIQVQRLTGDGGC